MINSTATDPLSLPGRGALAVWARNVRVWRKLMRYSIVLNFGEPLIYLLGFGYGFATFVGDMGGMPYLTFLASGIVVSSVMSTTTFEAMYSVYTRMEPQKTYAAMLVSPLRVQDILAGELLWCASKGVLAGTAILLVGFVLGAITEPLALLLPIVVLLAGLAFAGLAINIAPFAHGYDYFSYFYTLVIVPMLLCSGVFYPLDALPAAVQWIAQFLPLYHAVELARPLATGAWPTQPLLHIAVLLLYAVAGYLLAVRYYRKRLIA